MIQNVLVRSNLQMEIGLLNTVTCPTSRPPMRKRRSSSSLLSLQLALEDDDSGEDGATRFMSADRGLAFRAPADVGVVGWNSILDNSENGKPV